MSDLSPYKEGILAGLADDYANPYPVGRDGYYKSSEAERWIKGRRLGLRLRELVEEEDVARKMRAER